MANCKGIPTASPPCSGPLGCGDELREWCPSSPLCLGLLAGSQQQRTSPRPDIVKVDGWVSPSAMRRSPAGAELLSEVDVLIVLPVWASTFCHGLLDAVMVESYPWG